MRTHFILGAALGVGIHLAMVAPASASGCPTRHMIEDSGPEIRVAVGVPDCSMAAEAPRVTFVDRIVAFLTGSPAESGEAPASQPAAPQRGMAVPTPKPARASAPPEGGLSCTVDLAGIRRDPTAKVVQVQLAGGEVRRGGRPGEVQGMLDIVATDGTNRNQIRTDFSAIIDASGQGRFDGPMISMGKGGSVSASILTAGGQAVGCSSAR